MELRGSSKAGRNSNSKNQASLKANGKEVLIMRDFYKCESDLCISTNGRTIKVDANRDAAIILTAVLAVILIALAMTVIAKSA
jgi:hypothetical protein